MAFDKQKKSFVTFLFFFVGIFILLRTVTMLWNSYLPDFAVYYHASQMSSQQRNPYIDGQKGMLFLYPTPLLFFLSPLALVSFSLASKIWLLVSVVSFCGSLFLLQKIFKVSLTKIVYIFLLSVIAFPFKFTLGMGQINLFVLLFLSAFLYFYREKRVVLSSMFLSIAIFAKLFPLVFLLSLFKDKNKKYLMCVLLIVFLFFVGSFILYQNSTLYYVLHVWQQQLQHNPGAIYYNQSVTGVLSRLLISKEIISVIQILSIILVFSFILLKRFSFIPTCVALLTATLLLNSLTWQHHMILLIIPFFFLLSKNLSKKQYALLFVGYLCLAYNIVSPEMYQKTLLGNIILSHGFLGMCILLFLLLKPYEKQ